MRRFFFLLGVLACAVSLYAEAPRVFLLSPARLESVRDSLRQGESQYQAALEDLRKDAQRALKLKAPSVMDKKGLAASGDKHDYFSFGPYWWPDPSKPDGLPYLRHDGVVNTAAREQADNSALGQLSSAVEALGLAYWFTGEEVYALKVKELVSVWFLDPATRMNPNFQHAQAIPGICTGRGIGLIEARHFVEINESLALIAGSAAWGQEAHGAMSAWLEEFYAWLDTSVNGRDEKAARNNHGTWYDLQKAHLALVLGKTEQARAILTEGLRVRLAHQIEPTGEQPLELARTKSLEYSCFNLEALFGCATLAEQVGVDWWHYQTADGRSLQAALSYLAPYADASLAWPRKDLHSGDRERIRVLLAAYLSHQKEAALLAIFEQFQVQEPASARWRLLYGIGVKKAVVLP